MSDSRTFQRRDDLVAVDMDGESVMMCIESGAYFGLNSVASVLWKALSSPQSEDSLCQQLLAAYDVDVDTCRRDVSLFLSQLINKGLIKSCP